MYGSEDSMSSVLYCLSIFRAYEKERRKPTIVYCEHHGVELSSAILLYIHSRKAFLPIHIPFLSDIGFALILSELTPFCMLLHASLRLRLPRLTDRMFFRLISRRYPNVAEMMCRQLHRRSSSSSPSAYALDDGQYVNE